MATRTQVANYIAGKMASGRAEAVQEAAAWLTATGRTRQAEYLARDVAKSLAERGYLYVRITSARAVTAQTQDAISEFLRSTTGARELELELFVDKAVIGGVRIETPTAQLDATVRQKLVKLVEGVH